MALMRAAVCREYGKPGAVRVEDGVEVASPGPGQVRVRVRAAAVNFPDVLLVANQYQLTVPTPFVPGSEFAGEVVEVASDVRDVAVGDRVFGAVTVGAFGEQIVLSAGDVRPIPPGIDDRLAAAFGVAHRTAYHTLRSVAGLRRGDELIVLGAGGGVGLAAVRIGAALGASVTAVASSTAKLEVAAANGAARCVNHTAGDLRGALRAALPGGADVVVDPVGGPLAEPALRSLRYRGRFVTVGYASGVIPRIPLNLVLLKGVEVLGIQLRDFLNHRAEDAARDDRELLAMLADGSVRPHIGAAYPLDEVVAALRHVAHGRAIGKVVLDIAPSVARAG